MVVGLDPDRPESLKESPISKHHRAQEQGVLELIDSGATLTELLTWIAADPAPETPIFRSTPTPERRGGKIR